MVIETDITQTKGKAILKEAEALITEVQTKSIRLAVLLYEIKTEGYYKLQGYETFRGYIRGEFGKTKTWANNLVKLVDRAKLLGLYKEMVKSNLSISKLREVFSSKNGKAKAGRWLKTPVPTRQMRTENGKTTMVTFQLSVPTYARLKHLSKNLDCTMEVVFRTLLECYGHRQILAVTKDVDLEEAVA